MKFSMTVNLGNAAMSTSDDLAALLRDVASKIESNSYVEDVLQDESEHYKRNAFDTNGNRVGVYEFKSDTE